MPPLFDWDAENADHIVERHGITPAEAEEAMADPRRIRADAYQVPGEQRRAIVGATEGGRILYVVYTRRGGMVRVVTARDAVATEQRRYRRGRR